MVKNNHQLNLFKLYCSNLAIRQIYIYNISNPTVWSKSKSHKNATNIPKWNKSSRSRRLLCVTAVGAKLPNNTSCWSQAPTLGQLLEIYQDQKKSALDISRPKLHSSPALGFPRSIGHSRDLCVPHVPLRLYRQKMEEVILLLYFLSAALIELRGRAESATLCPDQNFHYFYFLNQLTIIFSYFQ